ncbi:MAG: dihydrofolate reductase [Chromatiales bacterium]|jgi:dihydrofolate reductase
MTEHGPLISIVAAMAKNGVIGIDNRLPWHLPDDLKHFKQLTLDKTIVMGRNTWESLPGLLPRRRHIVISRRADYQAEGAEVMHSITDVLAATKDEAEIFIVGGANLYAQMLPYAQRMYLTEIDAEIDGDAFFPAWDAQQWHCEQRQLHAADERHAYAFEFLTYERTDDN